MWPFKKRVKLTTREINNLFEHMIANYQDVKWKSVKVDGIEGPYIYVKLKYHGVNYQLDIKTIDSAIHENEFEFYSMHVHSKHTNHYNIITEKPAIDLYNRAVWYFREDIDDQIKRQLNDLKKHKMKEELKKRREESMHRNLLRTLKGE